MWNLPNPAAIAHNWNALSHYPDRHATAAVDSARVHLDLFKAFLDKLAADGGAIDVAAEARAVQRLIQRDRARQEREDRAMVRP